MTAGRIRCLPPCNHSSGVHGAARQGGRGPTTYHATHRAETGWSQNFQVDLEGDCAGVLLLIFHRTLTLSHPTCVIRALL